MAQATGMLLGSEGSAGGKVWIGLKTVMRRECAVIAGFWSVTLAPPVISTLLYFAIFGDILGKRIGSFGGVDYLQYVAPGLIILWVIPYAFGHTAAGFLGARFFKYVEEIHWARGLALANPLLYMVNAVRYGMIGVSDVSVGIAFATMGALGVVLSLVAVKLLALRAGFRD